MAILIAVSVFSLKVTSAHSYLRVSFLLCTKICRRLKLFDFHEYWLADRYLTGRSLIKRITFTVFVISGLSLQEPRLLSELGKPAREDYKEIGLWLAENTEQDASIAVVEIGTIGWFLTR